MVTWSLYHPSVINNLCHFNVSVVKVIDNNYNNNCYLKTLSPNSFTSLHSHNPEFFIEVWKLSIKSVKLKTVQAVNSSLTSSQITWVRGPVLTQIETELFDLWLPSVFHHHYPSRLRSLLAKDKSIFYCPKFYNMVYRSLNSSDIYAYYLIHLDVRKFIENSTNRWKYRSYNLVS